MTLLVWFLKTALLQGLALALVAALRRHPAATRRSALVACLLAVCALPLVELWGPGLGLATPSPATLVSTRFPALAAVALPPAGAAVRVELDGLAAAAPSPWPSFWAGLWALGFAALALRWVVGAARVRRLCRASTPWRAPRWSAAAASLARRPVRLLRSEQISTPLTTGVLHPAILLPAEAEGWSAARLGMALRHEAAHVRRADSLWINLSLLLRAVQWLNPLAWWLHRQLRLEMELAADEAAAGRGSGVGRYARFLLDLATRVPPAAELAMARRSGLELRLRRLAALSPRRARRAQGWIGWAVLGLGVGLGLLGAKGSQDAAALPSDLSPATWQAAVGATAQRLRQAHPAATVRIGVMRVDSGALVASAGSLDEPYGSGSTVKPLTVAAALEEGVPTSIQLDCRDGTITRDGREYRDYSGHGVLSLTEALARSSNVAMVRLLERMPPERLFTWLEKQGVPTTGRVDPTHPAGAATGTSLDLSIRELLVAYATIANDGVSPASGARVLHPETARAVLAMLRDAVLAPGSTLRQARVEGVAVAGKTGTTDRERGQGQPRRAATFVGVVPADAPRWVVAVAVDGANPDAVGGSVAAPAFASLVEQARLR